MNNVEFQSLVDRVKVIESDVNDLKLISAQTDVAINNLKQNKVSYKTFIFVTTSLISLIGGLLYIIYEQNIRLSEKQEELGKHVYTIEGAMNQLLNHVGITNASE